MAPLTKYGVAYWHTLFNECGNVVALAIATSGLDWTLSFAPKLHFITRLSLAIFEIVECLTRSAYLETFLVIPWALGSYHISRLLSTNAFITVQLARKFLYWACSTAARLYLFADGPSEQISLEWHFDILRATAHLLTVALCLRGRKFLSILFRYFQKALGVSRAYGLLILTTFFGLSIACYVYCSITRKDPRAELIRIWYELTILKKRWLEMRTKAFHGLKISIRDYFVSRHRKKLLKQDIPHFQYDSLDKDSIRLLKLKRRSLFSGVIQAELESRPFHEADFQYEALSYTWGSPSPKSLILINGHPFYVGPNLHAMLHARSMMFGERLVWVDAICINQNDGKEKSVQVKRMEEIYPKSKRTIAWLGDSFDTPLAVKMIHKIVNRWEMFDQAPDEVFDTYLWKTRYPEWRALSLLVKNEYFSRIWVFQEVMLGNNFQFYVGGHYLSFDYMNKALSALGRGGENTNNLLHGRLVFCPGAGGLRQNEEKENPETVTGIWQYWSVVSLRRFYGTAYTLSLGYLLSKSATSLKSKYAHDKVYGMLGVVDGPAGAEMKEKIDYDKRVEEIWKEVAVAHFQPSSKGCIQSTAIEDAPLMLAHAGIGFGDRPRCVLYLPSWVPDWNPKWSMPDILNNVEPLRPEFEGRHKRSSENVKMKFVDLEKRNYSAGGRSNLMTLINQERWTLTVDAVQVDTLHKDRIGDHFRPDFDTEKLVEWFLQTEAIRDRDGTHLDIPHGQGKEEALWRTLIADWADVEHPAPADYAKWFDIWRNLHVRKIKVQDLAEQLEMTGSYSRSGSETRLSTALVATISQLASRFLSRFRASCKERRFCVTSGCRLALVPHGSLPGDVVCVIRSVHTPFIVRPLQRETRKGESSLEGEYLLVGECYVHGIMDGEAMPNSIALQKLILV
jgi:hypothetical protein